MTESEWLRSENAWEMMWRFKDEVSSRKGDLFGCACCRRIWDTLSEECREQIRIIERYADDASQPDVDAERLEALLYQLLREAPESDRPRIHGVFWSLFLCWRDWEFQDEDDPPSQSERCGQAELVREILGNPFRTVEFEPSWRDPVVVAMATSIYEDHDFGRMPSLGDALMIAGCDLPQVLDHCRSAAAHFRGCWVVDAILGKS